MKQNDIAIVEIVNLTEQNKKQNTRLSLITQDLWYMLYAIFYFELFESLQIYQNFEQFRMRKWISIFQNKFMQENWITNKNIIQDKQENK